MEFQLHTPSSRDWLNTVLSDFNSFLIDHASCERKASASCLAFVVKYRDKPQIVHAMTAMAIEELEHFRDVLSFLNDANLLQGPDEKDPYVNAFLSVPKQGSPDLLLDRLLIGGLIESRGCERFSLIAEALAENSPYKAFYTRLGKEEQKHMTIYFRLAKHYFEDSLIEKRLEFLAQEESRILQGLATRPRLY